MAIKKATHKKHIACVFGTRPEAIKMAPVVHALQAVPDVFRTTVTVTAQHREMLDQVLETFSLTPQVDLDLMRHNQTLAGLNAQALVGCETLFKKIKPDAVLVQGDTTTTLSAALAAFYLQIPVGHVEAGLRTFDPRNPFPEEINRRMVTTMAQWHFAATRNSYDNLLAEGISKSQIFITGTPVVDAIRSVLQADFDFTSQGMGFDPALKRIVLVTAHRRENFGKPLQAICRALFRLAHFFPDVIFVFPVHPNPMVRKTVNQLLGKAPANLKRITPMDYPAFINLLRHAELVLTDSGGIQEEAPALGVPALILRKKTERPEALKAGARLIALDEDTIVREVSDRLRKKVRGKAKISCPFGDGRAAARIVDVLLWHFKRKKTRPRDYKYKQEW